MDRIKLWPHLTIVGVVVALIAGLGVAFWMTHEQTTSAAELPYAARIQRVDGEVAFSDSLPNTDANGDNAQWVAAVPNQPFSEGDRIYTRDNARTSLAFSGRNFARLDPNTSLDVVSLGDRRTQLALRDGSAMFDVGYLQPNEVFEVATPNGAINFDQPGLYNVGFDNNGGVLVSVLSGLARVVGLGGSGAINKGEMLTLVGQAASELALSRLNGQDAGRQVDDYYRYQYPNSYDGRYNNNYEAYLSDPNYYDPYERNASYQYVSSNIPGVNDLDYYGDWQNVAGYGNAWRPRVDSNWVPYQQGQWINNYPYGPTWVSSEPWGYAPYHYGRWANVGNQWYWIPEAVNTTPTYAPALVAFVPLDNNQIGWVPLGPGDNYAPRYYDSNWQPRYLTRTNVVPAQLINYGVPGAVTVVPVDAWGRPIDRRSIRRIDQQRLAAQRATLDPLTLTPLRNAVIHSALWTSGRGKIDLPPGIAKKLRDRPVFVADDIRESKFRKDLPKWMRVERVSDKARNEKFKVRDERGEARADNGHKQEVDQGRRQEADRASAEAAKVNKQAERQTHQLEAQRHAQSQPQGQRVGNPAKPEFKGPPIREGKQQPKERKYQSPTPRQAQPQPHGERVGNPAKHQAQSEQPKHEGQPKGQPQGAPRHERKPPEPAGQGNAGGGKGKGKGKP